MNTVEVGRILHGDFFSAIVRKLFEGLETLDTLVLF